MRTYVKICVVVLFVSYSGLSCFAMCPSADLTGDCQVNFADFAVMASQWLEDDIVSLASFSLDTNPDWPTEGQWQFGTPMGMGGAAYGYPDPNSGYTGQNVYGVNLNGDYDIAVGGPYTLTAGPFDCSPYYAVELSFARWLNTDTGAFVRCSVEVSNDGSFWWTIWENPTDVNIADNQWQKVRYDINQPAAGYPAVFVRWSYQILNGGTSPFSGWNIDDIELSGRPITIPDEDKLRLYLRTLRTAISQYEVQHRGCLPGVPSFDVCPPHTAGIGDITASLTSETNIQGEVPAPGEQAFGPYMQRIPENPFNMMNTIRVDVGAIRESSTAGLDTHGWVFNTGDGSIQTDDCGVCNDPNRTPHIYL